MVFGIGEVQNVTIQNITRLGNFTDPAGFFVGVNNDVYGGWLFFVGLAVLWFILFRAMDERVPEPLVRVMYAGAGVSVIALLLRVVEVSRFGVVQGLVADVQLWVFPLVTMVSAWVVWALRD